MARSRHRDYFRFTSCEHKRSLVFTRFEGDDGIFRCARCHKEIKRRGYPPKPKDEKEGKTQ